DDPNQSLDDADIKFAKRGNLILLSIRPYGEDETRFLVFNTQTRQVVRVDALGQSCQTLPEDHGILFPGGTVLRTGEVKVFDPDATGFVFERMVRSPNGEDVLYVFHRHHDGLYLLCPYNLIQKEVVSPLTAHGWTLFQDGTLVVFKADDNPTRVHPMQIWNTPFVSDEFHAALPEGEGLLARIGNKDLVRGISDAYTLVALAKKQDPNRATYEALVASTNRFNDAYYWVGEEEVGNLRQLVLDLRATAELIIDEYEKVQDLRRRAREVVQQAASDQARLLGDLRPDDWRDIQPFLGAMTDLRRQRGQIITHRDVRYVDSAKLDVLETEIIEAFDGVSQGCVRFLLGDEALTPVMLEVRSIDEAVPQVTRTPELASLQERLDKTASGVDLLSEVVAGLEVEDPTQKTEILGQIGEVYALVNRVRAVLKNRRKELSGAEASAEFAARFQLLGQAVQNALGLADTPMACDDQLASLMLQLEEMEARFADYEDFLPQLFEKREEITEAFASRKQQLVDDQNRRISGILQSADRILDGVNRRARAFKDTTELNAWFASDPMVLKLHQLAEQLADLGDTVKQDELQARLKSARQDALRGLRDKLELFADGSDLIAFGKHRFTVNTQPLELTVVPRADTLSLHLTGTDLYLDVQDEEFLQTRPYWNQSVVSETPAVYRAEYLAANLLFEAESGADGMSLERLTQIATVRADLVEHVRKAAASRFEEGYDRGIHDADAAAILQTLTELRAGAGVLRHPPTPRALAMLFWAFARDKPAEAWRARARSLRRLRQSIGPSEAGPAFATELAGAIAAFAKDARLNQDDVWVSETSAIAGAYLADELAGSPLRFTVSADASTLTTALHRILEDQGGRSTFDDELRALEGRLDEQLRLAQAWVHTFANASTDDAVVQARPAATEAAVVMLVESILDLNVTHVRTAATVEGLLGQHSRVQKGMLNLRLDEFETRLNTFRTERVPGYQAYRQARTEMVERERHRLRVDEYKPRVMSAFVRNKLINDAYLPLIGDNLAKQLGAAGSNKRTDLMGLLLLISPPGYGKTTLMEYVANRLGLVFMKINGPSLGHSVVSLDPDEAPNATARQEVEKINLAFEMGNYVLLYLDDIQFPHPDLLQKFISLCDG
ncbi:MAG: DNA repair ATPase, partial [Myxococcota bacterium]